MKRSIFYLAALIAIYILTSCGRVDRKMVVTQNQASFETIQYQQAAVPGRAVIDHLGAAHRLANFLRDLKAKLEWRVQESLLAIAE